MLPSLACLWLALVTVERERAGRPLSEAVGGGSAKGNVRNVS